LLRFCFSYFGRTNRAKYWIGIGIVFAMIALGMWLSQLAKQTIMPMSLTLLDHVLLGWMIAWALSMFAIAVRRLRDMGLSGWLVLAVPIVGTLTWAGAAPVGLFVVLFINWLIWLGMRKTWP
jgi:uncharacterized membrane protein YhaH (DUF805 family)